MFIVIFLNLENTKIWVNDVLHYYAFEVKSFEYYLLPIPYPRGLVLKKLSDPVQPDDWVVTRKVRKIRLYGLNIMPIIPIVTILLPQ
jgi:hypothetical protein